MGKLCGECAGRSLRQLLGLMIHWEASQDCSCSCTHGYDLSQWRNTEQNQQREKVLGVRSRETRRKLPTSSVRGGTQDVPTSPNSELWQHMWNVICRGSSVRLGTQVFFFFFSFYSELIVWETSAWHITTFQIPWRKAGACCKPSCLHKQFRHSEPFMLVKGLGTLLKSKLPDVSQGPTL